MAILLTDANGNFVPQGLLPDGSSFKENVTSATGSQFVNIRNESGTEIFTQTNPGSVNLIGNNMEELLLYQSEILNTLRGGTGVFGIEWDITNDTVTRIGDAKELSVSDFDNIYPFSNIRRCNLSNDGQVNAYYGDPTFVEDGTNGQVMVEIPKFYYKSEIWTRGYRWWVSPNKLEGFIVHPMFIRNNIEKQFIYIGAYEGCIYDISADTYLLADEQVADFTSETGDMLSSIINAKPCSGETQSLTLPNARILAQNRGSGWEQQDFLTSSALQLLMLTEYATFDMQTAIGKGIVEKVSGIGNESENTGQTSSLGNNSGMADGTNGLVSVSYRGIENFWGNIWKWIDGINIKANHIPYIADNSFQSDLFIEPYKPLNVVLSNQNGYGSNIAYNDNFDYGFLPIETSGSSSTYLTDYYYQNTGNRVALLGGYWNHGLAAGARCWRLYYSSAASDRDFGARLLFVPQN